MTNIGHFRAVAQLLKDQSELPTELWVAPPTRMDEAQLKKETFASLEYDARWFSCLHNPFQSLMTIGRC
jgi:aconitase B